MILIELATLNIPNILPARTLKNSKILYPLPLIVECNLQTRVNLTYKKTL